MTDESWRFERDEVDRFAQMLADRLTMQFHQYNYQYDGQERNKSMGLHLSTYDTIGGDSVPDMFLITSFSGIEGTVGGAYVYSPEFVAQRQTYFSITEERGRPETNFADHNRIEYRRQAQAYFEGRDRTYFNGDVLLFANVHPVVNANLEVIAHRGWSNADIPAVSGNQALVKVKVVADCHERFCKPESVRVGNPCYNLIIMPSGEFRSTTGNAVPSGVLDSLFARLKLTKNKGRTRRKIKRLCLKKNIPLTNDIISELNGAIARA